MPRSRSVFRALHISSLLFLFGLGVMSVSFPRLPLFPCLTSSQASSFRSLTFSRRVLLFARAAKVRCLSRGVLSCSYFRCVFRCGGRRYPFCFILACPARRLAPTDLCSRYVFSLVFFLLSSEFSFVSKGRLCPLLPTLPLILFFPFPGPLVLFLSLLPYLVCVYSLPPICLPTHLLLCPPPLFIASPSLDGAGFGAPPAAFDSAVAPGVCPSLSVPPSIHLSAESHACSSVPGPPASASRPSRSKSSTAPSPSPRHNPAPKRPAVSKLSTKSSGSASKSRGVLNVKQVTGSNVFLRQLPLDLITLPGLRTLLIGHKVRGRSNRSRDFWISLLKSHECTPECELLTYEVEHLVSGTAPAVESPSDEEVKAAVGDLINKHLKTDDKFPPSISRTIKDTVITKWLDYFSNQSMKMVVCSVCSERLLESQTELDPLSPDLLQLLSNPSLPPGLHPTGYDFERLHCAILDPQGIVKDSDGATQFVVCKSCSSYLSKSRLPPLSLANDNYLGFDCVPDHIRSLFETATPVELSLVSRYRVRCTVHKYSSKTNSADAANSAGSPSYAPSQRYNVGNTITFANECSSLLSILPPPAEALGETICVMFIGSVYPSPEEIQKMTPLLARRNVVWKLLNWLKDNHFGYKDVVLSRTNLDAILPNEDPSIPTGVFISHLPSTARETESSGYTNDQMKFHWVPRFLRHLMV